MARKNIPLTIRKPGTLAVQVSKVANDAANTYHIPFRYPFADIANYNALKAAGFFRHATTTVSSELGGSATTNTASALGFQLPRTEKLVLLAHVTAALTTDKHFEITISGSAKYGIADKTVLLVEDASVTGDEAGIVVAAGSIVEIDLFEFGLLLDEDGEIVIEGVGNASANADDGKVSYALLSRVG